MSAQGTSTLPNTYIREFYKFNERLGCCNIEFKSLLPKLYLSAFLKESLGYVTNAMCGCPLE